jgi:PAS domain S-box-containing protein
MLRTLTLLANVNRLARRCRSLPVVGTVLLTLVSLLGVGSSAVAPAHAVQRDQIRVVMDDNYPPYVFMDEQGKLKGIIVDQWQLWAKKTGIRAELTGKDWADAQQRMVAGEFDVIDTIFRNEKRELIYDFTKPYARLDVPLFFHADIGGIRGVADVKGFLVGAKAGDAAVDFLKNNGVTSIAEYPSYEKLIEAATSGKLKVFTVDKPPAHYFMHKLGISNQFRETAPMFSGEFHRAVAKGNRELLAQVEAGFGQITPAEYAAIDKTWLGAPIGSVKMARYFLATLSVVGLVLLLLLAWLWLLKRAVRAKTAELTASEERYRTAIEDLQDVYYRADAAGRLLMISPSGATLLGFPSPADMVGLNIRESFYLDPTERDRFLATLTELGRVDNHPATLRKRDGSLFHATISSHLLHDPLGQVVGVEGMVRDVSAQYAAEQALLQSEERYRELVEQSAAWLWETDATIRHIYSNNHVEFMLGYPVSEFLSMDLFTLLHPEDHEIVRGIVDRAIHARQGWRGIVLRWKHRDGSWRFIQSSGVPQFDAEGVCVGLHGVDIEVTDRMKLEEEQERNQRLESLGLLAGGIAHDFNNILTSIIGNISLARMLIEPESKAQERLLQSERAGERAVGLTRQLLTFARGGEPVKKVTDPFRLLSESAELSLRGARVTCDLERPAELWAVEADEGQLTQVFNNLIINAVHAMPNGGQVTLRAVNCQISEGTALPLPPGKYVCISIADQGVGIPQEHLERIFDPYFTTKTHGTGLGLTSAYSIVKKHGGTMTVTSEINQGSCFELFLPAATGRVPTTVKQPASRLQQGMGRVLVMDDEEQLRTVMTEMLTVLGYTADSCGDGQEAVDRYCRALDSGDRYVAVILDLTIPGGMGGKEASELIRALDPTAILIAASGYSNDPVMANPLKFGFNCTVAKPFQVHQLAGALHQAIIRSALVLSENRDV